jgi:hypothetical protein
MMAQLQRVNSYPLLPAAEAWQNIVDGLTADEGVSTLYSLPSGEIVAGPKVDTWKRSFQDGQAVELTSLIYAHSPVSGKGPIRIPAGPFMLQATEAELREIASYAGDFVHIWGTVRQDEAVGQVLEVSGWEPLGFQVASGLIDSVIEQSDGQTRFHDPDHNVTYSLPEAPRELSSGDSVIVEGWAAEPTEGNLPNYEWFSIARYTISEETPNAAPDSATVSEPPPIRQVNIDKVTLAYAPVPYPFLANLDGGPEEEYTLFKPAWLFSGQTDSGQIVEIVVDAVREAPLP